MMGAFGIVLSIRNESGRHHSTKLWYCRFYHTLMLQHRLGSFTFLIRFF